MPKKAKYLSNQDGRISADKSKKGSRRQRKSKRS